MGDDYELSYDELMAIAKVVTAFNGRKVEFSKRFLHYAEQLQMKVTKADDDILVLEVQSN